MKRLMIYFFYDKEGIVDDYIPYFLKSFKPYCEEIICVANGNLTDKSKTKLEKYSEKVLIRENIGFDSGAYKYAISQIGYEKIKKYDELILANFTMFGPIFSPQEIFNEMEKRDCDFWGITKFPTIENKTIAQIDVKEHLQSYFLAYKKNILCSDCFKNFWETLQIAKSYQEAVAFFELRNTSYFEENGYKSDCYVNFDKYAERIKDKIYFYYTMQQVKEDRMPFIKKKLFYLGGNSFPQAIEGGTPKLLEYIKENTDYDINLIIQSMHRTGLSTISVTKIIMKIIRYFIYKFIYIKKRTHYIEKETTAREVLFYKTKYKNI